MTAREPVLVSAVRCAVGRARRGALAQTQPVDFGAATLVGALERVPALPRDEIDDVILGCAMPEAEQGLNIARQVGLRAGLPVAVPGMTINRFCSSGLAAIALGAAAIETGSARVVAAGGVESMSLLPMEGHNFVPDPELAAAAPNVYISMGLTAERVAKEYKVSREDQDAFALASHEKALAAQDAGRFADEIVALRVRRQRTRDGRVELQELEFARDEGPRPGGSLEALAALRPAFSKHGSATAGNSSQMSDGAAATVLMSLERAEDLGLTPQARLASFAVAGVPPELMGIGPVQAVPAALAQAGVALDEIALIELNEAFASPSLAVIRALEFDPKRVNVNGGAIALGHPLGCTGAKLVVTLLAELQRRGERYGLVTMCVGGGMGAAGVLENLVL